MASGRSRCRLLDGMVKKAWQGAGARRGGAGLVGFN